METNRVRELIQNALDGVNKAKKVIVNIKPATLQDENFNHIDDRIDEKIDRRMDQMIYDMRNEIEDKMIGSESTNSIIVNNRRQMTLMKDKHDRIDEKLTTLIHRNKENTARIISDINYIMDTSFTYDDKIDDMLDKISALRSDIDDMKRKMKSLEDKCAEDINDVHDAVTDMVKNHNIEEFHKMDRKIKTINENMKDIDSMLEELMVTRYNGIRRSMH